MDFNSQISSSGRDDADGDQVQPVVGLDYFSEFGARKLALMVLKDAALELARDPLHLRNQTKETIAWISGLPAPIMFSDCAESAGLTQIHGDDTFDGESVIERFRKTLLDTPELVLSAITAYIKAYAKSDSARSDNEYDSVESYDNEDPQDELESFQAEAYASNHMRRERGAHP